MTAPLRQTPNAAVGASPTDPITWAAIGRTLAGAVVVGGFLAFTGAFGTDRLPFLMRAAYMIAIALAGATLGIATFRMAARIPGTGNRRLAQGLVSGLLMSFPMTVVIWAMGWALPGGGAPLRHLPGYYPTTVVTCVLMTLLAVGLHRQAYYARLAVAQPPAPPKFLERLPLKLRGAEVWAVEAEDHYLRLHTSKGQDLILLRLADALDELEGVEGAQVHRSWWVARDAIADARRGDGRATLTLKDGSEVPVSRTYAKIIRDKGWI